VGETFDVRNEQEIFYDVVDPVDSKRSSVFKDDAEIVEWSGVSNYIGKG
jgi:hypothetical protein